MTAAVQIKGINSTRNNLRRVRTRVSRRSRVNHKAVIILDRWVQKNFQEEGAMTGKRWKELADSTKKQRRTGRKKGKGHRILQDTGQLRSRWAHFFNNRMARLRSKMPYGKYHDSEEPRRGKLPRRQILPDKKHVMPQLMKLYGGHVRSSLR